MKWIPRQRFPLPTTAPIPNANWRVRLSKRRDYQTRTGRVEAASSQVKRWRRRGYLERVYGTYVALYRRTRRHCTAVKCIPKPSASVTTLWVAVPAPRIYYSTGATVARLLPAPRQPSRPQGFFFLPSFLRPWSQRRHAANERVALSSPL